MGTSLTGTKPKDTYDSLIKVGDNGPISGTAKYLSDGLGNDLPIAVSTSNVGIGTSSPAQKLHVAGANGALLITGTVNTSGVQLSVREDGQDVQLLNNANGNLRFYTNGNEVGRFLAGGGLTFNGDTAAANALDDYEEGTFTPTFSGTTATGGIVGGNYTKIGRVVYVNIRLDGVNFSGSTGAAIISGLPFTVASGFVYSNFSCNYQNCVDGSSTGGFFIVNTTQMRFHDLASVNFATFIDGSGREAILNGFYFV